MALRNWAGNLVFSTDRLHRPTSVEELQHLVAATPASATLGTGHSFNRIADTDGELVSVAGLPAVIAIDTAAGTVDLALGALGVFTRVTFAIQPSHDLRQDVWLDAPLDTVTERCREIMAAGYSVSMFTTWSRPEVIDQVWVKSRAGRPVVDGRARGARAAHAPQHPIIGQNASTATRQLACPAPGTRATVAIEFT